MARSPFCLARPSSLTPERIASDRRLTDWDDEKVEWKARWCWGKIKVKQKVPKGKWEHIINLHHAPCKKVKNLYGNQLPCFFLYCLSHANMDGNCQGSHIHFWNPYTYNELMICTNFLLGIFGLTLNLVQEQCGKHGPPPPLAKLSSLELERRGGEKRVLATYREVR